ncbi:hypothetical protein IC582_022051 [Cucumis melo]
MKYYEPVVLVGCMVVVGCHIRGYHWISWPLERVVTKIQVGGGLRWSWLHK